MSARHFKQKTGALAVTSRDEKPEPAPPSRPHVVLVCALVSLLIVVAVCMFQCPKYATPDDFIQDLYVRGAFYGTPSFLMPYSMLMFSAPVSLLYRLVPIVPWFPIVMFLMLAASFATLAVITCKLRATRPHRALLLVALTASEFMTCVYFSYTIVAFVTCAAGIALVLEQGCFKRPDSLRPSTVLAFVLVLEGFSLRPESGLAAALMFVPFLIWAVLCNRNVRTALLALTVVVLMGVSYLTGHLAYRITPGWEAFDTTFKAAQKVADYPHLTGDEARVAVPTMSDNDLSMIYEFLFADTSTYDLDTFTALDAQVHGYGISTLKSEVLSRKSFTAFVAGLVVIVVALAAYLARSLCLRGAARALMWSVPVMLALEYLIVFLRARPKMHVILPAFVAALFALAVACLAPRDGHDEREASHAGARGLIVPAALALCVLAIAGFVELKYARPNQATMRVEASAAARAYVDENPNKLVMFAHTQGLLTNTDCLSFDSWQMPSNALFVGGYEQYTAPWETVLSANGLKLDGLFMNLLGGTRMVAVADAEQAQMLATYLTEHSGSRVQARMDESFGMGSANIEYGVWSFSGV